MVGGANCALDPSEELALARDAGGPKGVFGGTRGPAAGAEAGTGGPKGAGGPDPRLASSQDGRLEVAGGCWGPAATPAAGPGVLDLEAAVGEPAAGLLTLLPRAAPSVPVNDAGPVFKGL